MFGLRPGDQHPRVDVERPVPELPLTQQIGHRLAREPPLQQLAEPRLRFGRDLLVRAGKEAGLVIDEPDGTRRIYRVDPEGVDALRGYLDQFWNQALAAFKRVVEQKEEEG